VLAPDAPVLAPDAPVLAPDAPVLAPDAPVQTPDAPMLAPEAPVRAPDAPMRAPEGLAPGRGQASPRLPRSIVRKLQRCVRGTVEELVERGIVTSGEVLARVLPQLTSDLRSAGIADPALRALYASVYRAFRRRRSLLLLNLQKQVRIEELPWVQAMERCRRADLRAPELARQVLVETAVLALGAFPQAMLPNKLVRELVALAAAADMPLPLTEEVAADIFMGRFAPKFSDAVRRAAPLLRGSIYARYYDIDVDRVAEALANSGVAPDRAEARRPDPLAQLCAARAGVSLGDHLPATNGQIIEQQLILSTHNLAALASLPELRGLLAPRWGDMARRCFDWVLGHLQLPDAGHHVALVRLKNAAYAWRQMVFFLSQPEPSAEDFVAWARARLNEQPAAFRSRFTPAMEGLVIAIRSDRPPPTEPTRARVFLGWTGERHWLMPPESDAVSFVHS
jgi:hypothetical protein